MLDEELGEKILYWSSLFVAERYQTLTQYFKNFRSLLKLKQTLVAFSILNYYCGLAVDRQHHRCFRFFHLAHHFVAIAFEGRQTHYVARKFHGHSYVDKFALNFTNREILRSLS